MHLRKSLPAFRNFNRADTKVHTGNQKLIVLYRQAVAKGQAQCICIMNFDTSPALFETDPGEKTFRKILDTSEEKWMGAGTYAPASLQKENNSGEIMPETLLVYQEIED
jgi:maltooligosyltrehalose trehalohydrolase